MKRKRVGNASTKYCLDPKRFNSDIANKLAVRQKFKDDLREVLYRKYKYDKDNGSMSWRAKREILVEVHKEFLEHEH